MHNHLYLLAKQEFIKLVGAMKGKIGIKARYYCSCEDVITRIFFSPNAIVPSEWSWDIHEEEKHEEKL